jgi:hypothetical protein
LVPSHPLPPVKEPYTILVTLSALLIRRQS